MNCNNLLTISVQLRPVHWPSFINHAVAVSGVHWPSVNISGECLQYQLESHETVQVGGIKWMDTLLLQFNVDTKVHLQKTSEHFSIFPDITNLVVLQSCFVQCCWIQWKIYWPLFTNYNGMLVWQMLWSAIINIS